jgi:beta-lactamase regulating signal transducer with metallopeptidase domain
MTPLAWLVKASIVLLVAAMVQATFGRRMSAAIRHAIWSLTIVGLLAMPVISLALPGWMTFEPNVLRIAAPVSDYSSAATTGASIATSASVSRSRSRFAFDWSMPVIVLYSTGVALLLARLGAQRRASQRFVGRATEVGDSAWRRLLEESAASIGVRRSVRLLASGEQAVPAMFGVRRAAIVLPLAAEAWPEERRRAVLLHELAHVARRDCLLQALAAVACAIYWVHPGVWWIARRMRVERELACDDCVLAAGMSSHDYAGHLLELAYELPGHGRSGLPIEMASPRQLERRLIALTDATRHRTVPGRAVQVGGVALALALVAMISTATTASGRGDHFVQSPEEEGPAGLWQMRLASPGFVEVRLCHADLFSRSEIAIRDLNGLSEEWLSGPERAVRLILQREAGVFTLDGTIGRGRGTGTYGFASSPGFETDFVGRGLEPPSVEMQAKWPGLGSWTHTLALYDMGLEFLEAQRTQQGASLSWHQILRIRQTHERFQAMLESVAREPARTSHWC